MQYIIKEWKRSCINMSMLIGYRSFFILQFADNHIVSAQDKQHLDFMEKGFKVFVLVLGVDN